MNLDLDFSEKTIYMNETSPSLLPAIDIFVLKIKIRKFDSQETFINT